MIEYESALKVILEKTPEPETVQRVPLAEASGRALAEDIRSDMDLPPFEKSLMDGFAVRAEDVGQTPAALKVVMDIPAGSTPRGRVESGQAASIMTGAPLPEGADTVVQVEWTSGFGGEEVRIDRSAPKGLNVSPRAEIITDGQTVLKAGTRIGVEEVGLLATVGCYSVPVFKAPTVAVLSTGDEVVPASEKPGPAQIRNSNGPSLMSFLMEIGLPAVSLGQVGDSLDATREAVKKGLECDCLLITGGVSAGAYDFVGDVLKDLGVEAHTSKIALKPGKPTVFGTIGRKLVFGLPGNPVATVVVARVLAEPALRKLAGFSNVGPRRVRATLLEDIKKKPDRLWFLHGRLHLDSKITVEPVRNHGSADIPSAAAGDCLIMAPKDVSLVEKGSQVDVVIWSRSI